MIAQQIKRHTRDEFDGFINLPENADKLFEFIGGEIVEVPSNPYSSQISAFIIAALIVYIKGKNLGHVTGEAGGYMVAGELYAPDVAFISKERQPELAREGYNPNPPDLAVEVVSPTDTDKRLRIKVVNYLAVGTMVWIVYPQLKEVEVYVPGQPVKIVDFDGVLDGGDVLPEFSLAVKEIFPE
jgi:Uma2 family endonuclease